MNRTLRERVDAVPSTFKVDLHRGEAEIHDGATTTVEERCVGEARGRYYVAGVMLQELIRPPTFVQVPDPFG